MKGTETQQTHQIHTFKGLLDNCRCSSSFIVFSSCSLSALLFEMQKGVNQANIKRLPHKICSNHFRCWIFFATMLKLYMQWANGSYLTRPRFVTKYEHFSNISQWHTGCTFVGVSGVRAKCTWRRLLLYSCIISVFSFIDNNRDVGMFSSTIRRQIPLK